MITISKLLIGQHFATTCSGGAVSQFFKLPTWYEYLPCSATNHPELTSISGIWLIVAAVIDILLKLAALFAVFIIIYAGIQYSTSRGNPDQTSKALSTIINASIGLVICIFSAVIITFIAGSFK